MERVDVRPFQPLGVSPPPPPPPVSMLTSLALLTLPSPQHKDMIPTVGFNMRKVTRGGVTFKVWDLGGQPRFRAMWERYCRGVGAAVFVVDAADPATFEDARTELHDLLARPALAGVPLLVLANKADLAGAAPAADVVDALDLRSLTGREVAAYAVSARAKTNLDLVLRWLAGHAK